MHCSFPSTHYLGYCTYGRPSLGFGCVSVFYFVIFGRYKFAKQLRNISRQALRSSEACSILRVLPFGVWTFCCCWHIGFPSDFPSWSVMWLTIVYWFIIYTLIMLTTAHADRGRPTLKDDERFRQVLVRDLQDKLSITVLLCPLTAPLEIRSRSKRLSRRLVFF